MLAPLKNESLQHRDRKRNKVTVKKKKETASFFRQIKAMMRRRDRGAFSREEKEMPQRVVRIPIET